MNIFGTMGLLAQLLKVGRDYKSYCGEYTVGVGRGLEEAWYGQMRRGIPDLLGVHSV